MMKQTGMDLNDAEDVRRYHQKMMNNPMEFDFFDRLCYGDNWLTSKFMQLLGPLFFFFQDRDY